MVRPHETTDGRHHPVQVWLTALMVALLLPAAAPVAGAWTTTTERAALARALGTMPRPLRMVLTGHRRELYRATATAPSTRPPLRPELIAAECETAVRMIREHRPFALTARQLGRVGVLAASTADPFLAAAGGGKTAPSHRGFELYSERMLHLIPFVIIGQEGAARNDLLDGRIDPAGYLGQGLELSADYRRNLDAHVSPGTGGTVPWAAFDVRSTPFAVSSVSVARAACRVSALWQWIWEQAGGAPAHRTDGTD